MKAFNNNSHQTNLEELESCYIYATVANLQDLESPKLTRDDICCSPLCGDNFSWCLLESKPLKHPSLNCHSFSFIVLPRKKKKRSVPLKAALNGQLNCIGIVLG